MIKTISLTISESFSTAIMIVIFLSVFGYEVRRVTPIEHETVKMESNGKDNTPWCHELWHKDVDEKIIENKYCKQFVPYKFYESSIDFAGPYRLYGVTPGQEARAAVETTEMRKLGESEIPTCTAVSKYKSNYCYNDAKMEAHLVARNHKGDIAIVWPINQRDMDSGFRFELVK